MSRARNCPDCQLAMHFLFVSPHGKEIELDRCHECGGVWFDAGEVEQVSGRALKFEAFDHETERACPVCARPLQAGVLQQAVPVERCGQCRGVFLDADDLEALRLKLKLTDKPVNAALVNGFKCAKCGERFPYSDGNATNKGLVCRGCVVNAPVEKLKKGERTGESTLGDDLGDIFSFFFDD